MSSISSQVGPLLEFGFPKCMGLGALKQQLQGGFLPYEVLAVIVIAIRFLKI